jgi:hypothetical protein
LHETVRRLNALAFSATDESGRDKEDASKE